MNTACELIVFGTKGDLAIRKLLPALYQLEKSNLLHPQTKIIGVARDDFTLGEYRNFVHTHLEKFLKDPVDPTAWQRFQQRLSYVPLELTKTLDYEKLCAVTNPSVSTIISYFAVPPVLFAPITEGLALAKLCEEPARVIIEKPIGNDLSSSIEINNQIAKHFKESQIYRIDHYLGKETVLNLLALRFANAIFATNWDQNTIDHVQITVAEEVGVEGRWSYYNDAGQMRDMVQNHLLQILSLIAMEPPVSLDAASIREEKLKVLRALRPIATDNIEEKTIRGQYTDGMVHGKPAPSYIEEEEAEASSSTETFVAIKAEIDNWRWAGVPFYLRTGKRMAKKLSEVVICFKSQPHNIFNKSYKSLPANKLILRLQPDEGVALQIMNKIPGLGENMQLQHSQLDLSFDQTFKLHRIADAYERLLLEAMLGRQYLFVHRKEVEQAWKWVDGIRSAWQQSCHPPVKYQAGSWGPSGSVSLLAKDGRQWDE